MKHLIFSVVFALSAQALAHDCTKFFNSDWASDEGYACTISQQDLQKYQLYQMEVCVGSAPYLEGRRFAHAQTRWIPMSQYQNPYSRADGLHEKFFDQAYSGLAYLGTGMFENSTTLQFESTIEGSTIAHMPERRTQLQINKKNLTGRIRIQYREDALIFKNDWQTHWDLNLVCEKSL